MDKLGCYQALCLAPFILHLVPWQMFVNIALTSRVGVGVDQAHRREAACGAESGYGTQSPGQMEALAEKPEDRCRTAEDKVSHEVIYASLGYGHSFPFSLFFIETFIALLQFGLFILMIFFIYLNK